MNNSNIVPTNEPSIYTGLDKLTTLEKNAIIRPSNPPPGIAGFLFDLVEEDTVNLESDISDNFIENNTTIQDQIGLRPEMVTVRGLVGEIVQTEAQADAVAKEPVPLPTNTELEPALTDVQIAELAEQKETKEREVSAVTDTQSLEGYFSARSPITNSRQSKTFSYFYELWKGRVLSTVDTPWGYFTDMAIQSFRANQDGSSRFFSSFAITFKKMRFATTIIIRRGQLSGRAVLQSAATTDNGVAGKDPITAPKNQSWLRQLSNP